MFNRKSGRILAVSRALIAGVFLMALVLDPTQPVRHPALGYALLTGFLVWSLLMTVVAWRSWWHDFRLAGPAQVVDIACFLLAVYFTETSNGEFVSPFTAFAVFLLINASIRWGWNGIAGTGLVLLCANGAAAALLIACGYDIDPYRFARRQTYMLVLAIMLTWIGSDRRSRAPVTLPEPPGIPGERRLQVMAAALAHTRRLTGARAAALSLGQDEEPWIEVMRDSQATTTHTRIGPGPLAERLGDAPAAAMLFDRRRGRSITARADGRLDSRLGPLDIGLADYCEVETGLVVPFTSAAGKGALMLWDIADLCIDDLAEATDIAREIGLALDREQMAALAQSAAVAGVRTALARDLHDSVAQFLAGTLFRLEALRHKVRDGGDPDPQIVAMKSALRTEQIQLRAMVDRLRRGVDGDRATDLVGELRVLLAEVGGHWHLATRFDTPVESLDVPIGIAYEARQLVREAVANAARHGQSRKVELTLQQCTGVATECVRLTIGDDGIGFPAGQPDRRPRSIAERVAALGGALAIEPRDPGTALVIDLPLRLPA